MLVNRVPWRSVAASVLWAAPLAIAPVALVLVPHLSPAVSMAIAAIVIAVTAMLSAWFGSTPWRSRALSSRMALSRLRHRHAVFVAMGGVAVVAALVAALGADRDLQLAASWLAITAGVAASTTALWATRQWRFAPRVRARQTVTLGAAASGWCAVAVLADHARFGATATLILRIVVVLTTGSPSVRAADRAV